MADDDALAQGSAGGPSGRTVSFHSRRRQSTGERIHEILENARNRAEGMGPDPVPVVRQRSSLARLQQQHSGDEANADEMAANAARGSWPNHQAVQPGGSSTRSRRSIYNHPRSQHAPSEDDEEPPPRSRPQQKQQLQQEQQDDGSAAAGDAASKPWWRKPLGKFQSVELDNKGSVARDHLALERTFLAWLRTSLAFASIGIAVTQLFRLNTSLSEELGTDANGATLRRMGKPLGATFLAISILTLLLGCRRYFRGQEWVMRGKFPASRGTIIIIAFLALAIMLVSLVVVIVIHPSDSESSEDL